MIRPSKAFKGRILVLSAATLWSLGGVLIKSMHLPPQTIACYRTLFASLFLFLLRGRGLGRPTWIYLLAAIPYCLQGLFFIAATKATSAANAIILQYTAPMYTFVLAYLFLGESIQKRSLCSLAIGMIGVAVIFFGGWKGGDLLGVALALISGFFFSVLTVVFRYMRDKDPFAITFFNNLFTGLMLLPISPKVPLGSELVVLLFMGVVQVAMPYILFTKGLQFVQAQEAGILSLIEPVLNPIWVALVIGEIPSHFTIVGGSLIALAIAMGYIPFRVLTRPLR
jgi:drug/metabolite transporter (DMT)-like permease